MKYIHQQSVRGFTMIELLVVVAVIALMSTLVMVNSDGMTVGRRFKAEVRHIGQTVEWARGGAISSGRTYGMVYDLDEQQYWILSPKNAEVEEGEEDELDILGEKFDVARGVKIESIQGTGGDRDTGGTVTIYFTADGVDGSHIVVVGREDSDEKLSIRFNAVIGAASVATGEQEFKSLD